jgi:hypothetical protein
MPLGPLQLPDILFPACRNTHTGALVAFAITALNVHVPAKLAASTMPTEEMQSANPINAAV